MKSVAPRQKGIRLGKPSLITPDSLEEVPPYILPFFGYRIHACTIANKEWVERKKQLSKRFRVTSSSALTPSSALYQERREAMRSFHLAAAEEGVERIYTGIVKRYILFDNSYLLELSIDPSNREEDDLPKVLITKLDIRNICEPDDLDLMEMMTEHGDGLRIFAKTLYQQRNKGLAQAMEDFLQLSPEMRLEILSKFCRLCGKTKCNCG